MQVFDIGNEIFGSFRTTGFVSFVCFVAKCGCGEVKAIAMYWGSWAAITSSSDLRKPKQTLVGMPVVVRKPPSRLLSKAK